MVGQRQYSEARSEFTMIRMPKFYVANDGRPRLKTLSSYSGDGFQHLLRRLRQVLTSKMPKGAIFCQLVLGCLAHKISRKCRCVDLHVAVLLGLLRIPIGQKQGNSAFAKLSLMKTEVEKSTCNFPTNETIKFNIIFLVYWM